MIENKLLTVELLSDLFGYDIVIDGDTMTAGVFLGEVMLYRVVLA